MSNKKWTEELVVERFEQAIKTLKKLPSVRARGYISSYQSWFIVNQK